MHILLRTLALSAAALLVLAGAAVPARAADVALLPSELLAATTTEQTRPGQFKKAPPWRIGMALGGVGNTWIVQLIEELNHEVSRHRSIGDFVLVESNWQPAKQVADVEDLLTKKIDVLIIAPVSGAVAGPLVEKVMKRGVPVITAGALVKSLGSTIEIGAGGELFGRQGGEYLVRELKGRGSVWAFRGVAGVDEDTLRYEGFRKSLAGSEIRITNEVFGDWSYARGKQLCENLVLSGNAVDGIWFSGAEMTRACLDVFQETGRPLVPMTGEGNNGYMRVWKQSQVKSIAPVFSPSIGAALIRAAVALLEGRPLYTRYFSGPLPINESTRDRYYRADLNDAYWMPSNLPEARLKELYRR